MDELSIDDLDAELDALDAEMGELAPLALPHAVLPQQHPQRRSPLPAAPALAAAQRLASPPPAAPQRHSPVAGQFAAPPPPRSVAPRPGATEAAAGASRSSSGKSPFLGDEKLSFVCRRLLETALGGRRFPSSDGPCALLLGMHAVQLALWLAPVALLAGTRAAGGDGAAFALAVALWGTLLQAAAVAASRAADSAVGAMGGLLDAEGGVQFDRWWEAEAFAFMLSRGAWLLAPLQVGCSAALAYGAFEHFGSGRRGVACWAAACTAFFAALVHAPPEPGRHGREGRAEAISRVVYAVALTLPLHSAQLSEQASEGILWAFAALPMCWTLGALPAAEVFLAWAAEQSLVHALGGTKCASLSRLAANVALSSGAAAAVLYLQSADAVIVAMVVGCVLAQSLAPLAGRQSRGKLALTACLRIVVDLAVPLGAAAWLTLDGPVSTRDSLAWRVPSGWLLVCTHAAVELAGQLQRPYLIGMLSNPFFARNPSRALAVAIRVGKRLQVWQCAIWAFVQLNAEASANLEPGGYHSVMHAVLLLRALRTAFRSGASSSLEIIGLLALEELFKLSRTESQAIKLAVAGFAVSRAADLARKLWFMLVVVCTSWSNRHMRNSFRVLSHFLATLGLPVWTLIAAVAALLDAPLVPLVGAPVFTVGFPRPACHHSQCASEPEMLESDGSSERALYKSQWPELLQAIEAAASSGALGQPAPNEILLVRHETTISWLRVLEAGSGYFTVACTGLELEQTSCHNVEGQRIDDVLEAVTEDKRPALNRWWAHTLTPLCSVPLESYAVSDMKLTGIITSPEVLEKLDALFIQCLAWALRDTESSTKGLAMDSAPAGTVEVPAAWLTRVGVPAEKHGRCSRVAAACHAAVSGGPFEKTAARVFSTFSGQLPNSMGARWLDDHPSLREAAVGAYRAAVKLSFDAAAFVLDADDADELQAALAELEADWHLGVRGEEWNRQLLARKPSLFTIEGAGSVYSASILSRGAHPAAVGRISGEAARGLWASLEHELLYLTNDNEERYSIQANHWLLRNLTVQAAAPPLGYAAFTSCAATVATP